MDIYFDILKNYQKNMVVSGTKSAIAWKLNSSANLGTLKKILEAK